MEEINSDQWRIKIKIRENQTKKSSWVSEIKFQIVQVSIHETATEKTTFLSFYEWNSVWVDTTKNRRNDRNTPVVDDDDVTNRLQMISVFALICLDGKIIKI